MYPKNATSFVHYFYNIILKQILLPYIISYRSVCLKASESHFSVFGLFLVIEVTGILMKKRLVFACMECAFSGELDRVWMWSGKPWERAEHGMLTQTTCLLCNSPCYPRLMALYNSVYLECGGVNQIPTRPWSWAWWEFETWIQRPLREEGVRMWADAQTAHATQICHINNILHLNNFPHWKAAENIGPLCCLSQTTNFISTDIARSFLLAMFCFQATL